MGRMVAQEWALQNPLPDPVALHDVYIDTTGFGWIGGEGGLCYYTTDFGQNWEARNLPPSFGDILHLAYVPGSGGQHVVVAGGKTAYSLDAGQTWTEVPLTGISTGAFNGLTAPADTALYLISNQGKLLKSADGGATWAPLSLPFEIEWVSLDFLTPNLGWLGSREGDILHTTDGGQSWTVLHDSTFAGRIELQFLSPQHGYMAAGRDVCQTHDGGQSWDTLALSALPFLVHEIAVIDSLNLLATQGARMAVSHDGGLTWVSDFNHPYVGTTNRGISVHPDGKVWAANRWRSLLYSTDFGDTWVDLFPAFKGFLGSIDAFDAHHVLAAGSRSHLIRTQNGGLDWEELTANLPPDLNLQGVEMLSAAHYVIATDDAELMSSRDSGLTWQLDTAIGSGFFRSLSTDTLGNLYALHTTADIYASTDSGASWTLIPVPGTQGRNMAWLTDSLGLVAATAGRIFRTEDRGASWDTIQTGFAETPGVITWATAQDVWVLARGFSDSVWYSGDAGFTWVKYALPRRGGWRNIGFSDRQHGWIIGGGSTEGYIVETTDGGQTWTEVRTGPLSYFDLTLAPRVDTPTVWVCGSGGGIDFFGILDTTASDTAGSDTTGGDSSTTVIWSQASPDWQVYPNPSQGKLTLKTPYGPEQALRLELLDLHGRVVASYAWAQVPPSIDLHQLPRGWYLLRMQQGDRIAFRRWKRE